MLYRNLSKEETEQLVQEMEEVDKDDDPDDVEESQQGATTEKVPWLDVIIFSIMPKPVSSQWNDAFIPQKTFLLLCGPRAVAVCF